MSVFALPGKNRTTKYYFFYLMRYDYSIHITHKTHFVHISDFLTDIIITLFILQLPIVKLSKMPSHNANISMEMLSLFTDRHINSVLL